MGKTFSNSDKNREYNKPDKRSFGGHRKDKGMIQNHGSKQGKRLAHEDSKERESHRQEW